jgi:ribosome-interacting GTPase 1
VLVGTPNVGKSSIVLKATGAHVKVAEYPFTTTVPMPGMCPFEEVQIELVDTPPVTADHIPGGLLGTIRAADIAAIIVDATAEALDEAEAAIGILRERGLILRTVPISDLDPSNPADHCAMLVVNKLDIGEPGVVETLRELYGPALEVFGISAETGEGLDKWIARVWELLASIRVFTKEPGQPADMTKPFTLPIGSTVDDLAHEIHRELPAKMKFARVWGQHRYSGMQVHRTEELKDRDVVEIHQ